VSSLSSSSSSSSSIILSSWNSTIIACPEFTDIQFLRHHSMNCCYQHSNCRHSWSGSNTRAAICRNVVYLLHNYLKLKHNGVIINKKERKENFTPTLIKRTISMAVVQNNAV
jgi:hypothetical protein